MIAEVNEPNQSPVEPAFANFYGFPFDQFQLEAMEHIRAGRSVMVAAPTSSGKTVVAEYALWRALQRGARAIYTTPIKALSNQKRRDLEELFPGQVGLLTGDRSENPEAPIVVMTTEVLRNMLVDDAGALNWVNSVVFDEVHYLADPDRGTVWEEAIVTCPPHVQLVCLSATIANAEEIAAWITETHRHIALVRHDERPVPLEHYYYTQNKLHLIRDARGQRRAMFPHERALPQPYPADVVRALHQAGLLPAIWFAFSRRAVEETAEICAKTAPRRNERQQMEIEQAIAWTVQMLPEEDQKLPQLSLLMRLLRRGVGFHHAGLLPPLKELVEHLFSEGLLSVVCATDTLAVGINMPARTVVISSLFRPFGGTLNPNDFRQLTGRAGRRGIDERGAVVLLPGPQYAFEDTYREVAGPMQPVNSAFRLRYSTLLSVLDGRNDDRLNKLVRSSLRQYQMKGRIREAEVELAELRRLLEIEGDSAQEDELCSYLELQAELSAAEKEQKRARNARAKMRTTQTNRRYEQAREARQRLQERLKQHPLHGRAVELERENPELVANLRQINKLVTQVRQAQHEVDQDAIDTAAAVRTVLMQLGYVSRRGLTRKAEGLREIVAPSGIVISELYEQGALHNLQPAELAEVLSWFACDVTRRRSNTYRLPQPLQRLRRRALDTFQRIVEIEEDEGIALTQGPSAWFMGVALAWCRGDSLADITKRIQLAEGDVVSNLNKTVDLVDQFSGLLERNGDRRLLAVAEEARRLLVRGLVAVVRTRDQESA